MKKAKAKRKSNYREARRISDQWEKYYQNEFHEWTKVAPFDRMVAAITHVANHQDIRNTLLAMADAINRLSDVLQAAVNHSKEIKK